MTVKKTRTLQHGWKNRPTARERADKDLAGHYVSERFPVVSENWSMGQVDEYISRHGSEFDALDYIYAVNTHQKLMGVISIRDLFRHSTQTLLKNVMKRDMITISPDTHREKIARLALLHNLRAIPIVKNGKLEGVILTNKILHIINRTLREHILSFSGVHHAHLDYDDTMQIPILESIIHRIPWLIFGLVGVIIAAGIIDRFESVLDAHLILAFFIPAIVYMSDALGTQNQTLLIRDMAVMGKELKIIPYFLKTTIISTVISSLIGILVYVATTLIWGESTTAFVIALAMFCTLMISSASSVITTVLFKKLGQDPALGSGPFATIISDVTSIIVYFIIVSALL